MLVEEGIKDETTQGLVNTAGRRGNTLDDCIEHLIDILTGFGRDLKDVGRVVFAKKGLYFSTNQGWFSVGEVNFIQHADDGIDVVGSFEDAESLSLDALGGID